MKYSGYLWNLYFQFVISNIKLSVLILLELYLLTVSRPTVRDLYERHFYIASATGIWLCFILTMICCKNHHIEKAR